MLATENNWDAVDNYINDLFVAPDTVLAQTLADSEQAGLPSISVTAAQGKFLHLLVMISGAKKILEIGTLGAYSTIWMARALPSDGKLITLESEEKHAAVARLNIERAGLSSVVEIKLGRAQDTLTEIARSNVPPFDFIFIDADKEGYPTYLEWSLKLSRPGTVIIADNVVRHGAVIDNASTDSKVQGARQFNRMLSENPRLPATVIQTVGSKGHDGFALCVVR